MMISILDSARKWKQSTILRCTGGMLLGAWIMCSVRAVDPRDVFGKKKRIYGQEKNLTTSSIARMNLVLHGI